jgi:hypothetical protein
MATTVLNLLKLRPKLGRLGAAPRSIASPPGIVVGHLHRRDFAITTFTQDADPGKRLEMYTTDVPR